MTPYNGNMTIDVAIKVRMAQLGLKDQSAAEPVIGIKQSQLSKWLRRVDVPSDRYAPQLADFLAMPVDEVLLLLARTRQAKQEETALDALTQRLAVLEEQVADLIARLAGR